MKRILSLIIIIGFFIPNFAVIAQKNKSVFDTFNIYRIDISAIKVQCITYGIPEQKAFTLEDKSLINAVTAQLESMPVVECDAETPAAIDPYGKLKIEEGGYEVSFKGSKSTRTFWISGKGEIAEYNSEFGSPSKFTYRIINENMYEWLWKLEKISRISESQKPNIPLANNGDIKVFVTVVDIRMQLFFDAKPKIVKNTIMVPVRNIAEAVGASVDWNKEKKQISIDGENTLILRIGDVVPAYYPYGKGIRLDAAPFIEHGRTYVPLRFVAEFFNKNVDYDSKAQAVSITDPVINGWCINKKGNYKIKVYEDYTFEGFLQQVILGEICNSSFLVIPFYTLESLSKPVTSIISAGRISLPAKALIDEVTKYNSKEKNFTISKPSKNECIISYEFNEKESNNGLSDAQRINVNYFKSDKSGTLFVELDCHLDYFETHKYKLLENLKTIQAIK